MRAQDGFDAGHLANATLITDDELHGRSTELPGKDAPLFVYCGSGHRSAIANEILVGLGYKEVYDLEDGIDRWIALGHPVV